MYICIVKIVIIVYWFFELFVYKLKEKMYIWVSINILVK